MTTWRVTDHHSFPKGDNPFGNKFYGYQRTQLVLPDGRPATYHGIDVGDCVHVVAVADDLTTFLVRQKRPNLLRGPTTDIPETWELPGGFVGERAVADAAREELAEETGKLALHLSRAGILYPSPGVSNETDTIYLGQQLIDAQVQASSEATEQDLRVVTMPFGQAYDMFTSGREPVAAQTVAALALVATLL